MPSPTSRVSFPQTFAAGTIIEYRREDRGYVYALISGDRAFYVGQTLDPSARLQSHRKRYPLAYMLILEGPLHRYGFGGGPGPLYEAERRWIERLDVEGDSTVGGVTFCHGSLENRDHDTIRARVTA